MSTSGNPVDNSRPQLPSYKVFQKGSRAPCGLVSVRRHGKPAVEQTGRGWQQDSQASAAGDSLPLPSNVNGRARSVLDGTWNVSPMCCLDGVLADSRRDLL